MTVEYDLVVIGAGISGIASARFYLEIHPQSKVLIVDRDTCPGGTWNARRSYPRFWTQWSVGCAEYSDLEMDSPPGEDTYMGFFKAKYTTKYLEKYVDHHDFAGQTLRDRIVFEYYVQSVHKDQGTWSIVGLHSGSTETIRTTKLIVASGPTSVPNKPKIKGDEHFNGPIIHQEGFGQSEILNSPHVKDIAVIGGGKSAADMVYACVKSNKHVSWIIRESGTGPGHLFPPDGVGSYKNGFELGGARVATILSPSIYSNNSYLTRFLHGTSLGNRLVSGVWGMFEKEMVGKANFDRKDAAPGYAHLTPHVPFFWANVAGGILNREDFWDTIAPNVNVHIADIASLDHDVIRLEDGTEIAAQAILLGTGWLNSLTFFGDNERIRLGLPHPWRSEEKANSERDLWKQLEQQADEDVTRRFPMLRKPPPHHLKVAGLTPYRVYKGIGPLDDTLVAFVGYQENLNYFRGVECQAIWATAFLDQKLNLPTKEQRMVEIARTNVYCRRRYLSSGQMGTFFPFESTIVTDRLLEEVGLTSHRKGWLKNLFSVNLAKDLRGLKDEYIAKYAT